MPSARAVESIAVQCASHRLLHAKLKLGAGSQERDGKQPVGRCMGERGLGRRENRLCRREGKSALAIGAIGRSGRCPVPRRLPSAAASHLSSSDAMLRTSGCATQSITGHVSPPSAIPSVAPDILQCANVATRTVVLSVVSRIDCLPWPVSFCSDRRCLIRTLANLPHNGAVIESGQNLVWPR